VLALSTQCQLLAVTRSVVYAQRKRLHKDLSELDLLLLQLLDEEYPRHPFYGSRRMTKYLHGCGHAVNRKRVRRLMQTLGLAGMAPGPHTSKPHPQHKIYPYLLRGVDINRPNQVWSNDDLADRLIPLPNVKYRESPSSLQSTTNPGTNRLWIAPTS
jgi:putative transposase